MEDKIKGYAFEQAIRLMVQMGFDEKDVVDRSRPDGFNLLFSYDDKSINFNSFIKRLAGDDVATQEEQKQLFQSLLARVSDVGESGCVPYYCMLDDGKYTFLVADGNPKEWRTEVKCLSNGFADVVQYNPETNTLIPSTQGIYLYGSAVHLCPKNLTPSRFFQDKELEKRLDSDLGELGIVKPTLYQELFSAYLR